MRPEFLTVEDVLIIQRDQLARYGGDPGLRDLGLLESAVAQPHATWDGQYLHGDLFQMAAAYLFHICQGHAFVDANKRTAYVAAIVFLRLNGISIPASDSLYDLTMAVAQGGKRKEEIAEELRRLAANDVPEVASEGGEAQ